MSARLRMRGRLIYPAMLCLFILGLQQGVAAVPTNVVILFADDLGYGDLGSYGHPSIATPHLDRMANEGMRFTQFYSAAPVCTPSRAGLLTGRLPIRSGMCSTRRRVLFPDSSGGLPAEEITLAEALKEKGYATACIGKWHLGHLPEYLPTRHGFDYYFGIPYSNDMKPTPLLRNEEQIEEPANQETLTLRYTEEAIDFIKAHREEPFFVYLAYTFPHVPLFASERFQDGSRRGLYGDVVEELDWSVGRILDSLREMELADNTLVVFTSDNGPWLYKRLQGGSAGLLRDGKGSTWDGGMRVPAIAWWPGQIAAGTLQREMATTMDLFPTVVELTGGRLPEDRVLDGRSIVPLLREGDSLGERLLFYYYGNDLMAVRRGPWKMHLKTRTGYGPESRHYKVHQPPLLYHLERDPSEAYDMSNHYPQIIEQLLEAVRQHEETLEAPPTQLEARLPK